MDTAVSVSASGAEPLSRAVLDDIGHNVFKCYQCVKCTSGCPLSDRFDLRPNQIMRGVQLNDVSVLDSRAIWLCANCQTCTTRCPQGIDVAGVMDVLRLEAQRRGLPSRVPEVQQFNKLFMHFVRWFGRIPELLFILAYKVIRRDPFGDMGMGMRMLKKNKFRWIPQFARTPKQVDRLADTTGKIAYFPGCAGESTARDYDETVRTTAATLGLELVEPPGWVCCGSSCAHATDKLEASALPLRTMATIERLGLDAVTSPCSNCFSRLKMAERFGAEDDAALALVERDTGHKYRGTVGVQHFVDTLMQRVTPEKIRARVEKPLTGLKVACYYGCLITRPAEVTGAENPEYPMQMDYLLQALGATTVDWSFKTDCCGGPLSVTQTELSLNLTKKIISNARDCGAEAIITMCPMCHMNLDARQADLNLDFGVPILHSTQLALLAFGKDAATAQLDKNIVDPKPLLKAKNLLCG